MVAAVTHIARANDWPMDRVWVWCDYISIPQRLRCAQRLAINSLASYASCADAFVIVAPPVVHADTNELCDTGTYNRRMWCRAENLCHTLRHGVEHMWVVSSVNDCHRLSDDATFMHSNLRVMQGDATREEDKLALVLPILGLYAEVFAVAISCADGERSQRPQCGCSSGRH